MARQLREVVFVDGVRTPFGKAKGQYAETRADDLVIKCIRELMRRNPNLPPERVDEVAVAATTQIGDQGLTIGRTAALLAGLPQSVPGYAIDRMCAGAMTAVTTTAAGIAFGSYDVVIAGGVEHMGRHPMGEGVDPNPRIVSEKIVDPEALSMGNTAENLHDRYPSITKDRADAYAVRSQQKTAQAYADGKIQPDLVPVATRTAEEGWGLATTDEPPRPGTTLEDLAALKTPFRSHGRVTAGNSAGINDGATAALLADEETARELGLPVKMRLVSFSFTGVEPEVMGAGPIPATEKALKQAGLTIDDIGAFEVNEAFAVQVIAFLEHFGIADDDPRVNPYGGAIAMGHPLASSGVRLMNQLARQFEERPEVRYGVTTMCIGIGMGGTVIWENPHWTGASRREGRRLMTAALTTPEFQALLDRGAEMSPNEVVTEAKSRDVALPHGAGTMALITLDNGLDHTRPNTFGPRSLKSLNEALDAALERDDVVAIGITGKPFILAAGADLSGLTGLGGRDDAKLIAQLGHGVFRKLGDGTKPTFGFINGLALGGGLEVALHCTYRTVQDSAPALGLPEVMLGLVPGWGGAYLVPNLVGAATAVKLIIENPLNQGKTLTGHAAFEAGLADAEFSGADFLEQSLLWAAKVLTR